MSVSDTQVIRQCFSYLPLQQFAAPYLDYRKQKLSTAALLKIFLTAQLLHCPSLESIEQLIRSDDVFQEEFELSSISKSQLSRRINDLPEEIPCALFQAIVHDIQQRTQTSAKQKHLPTSLALIDSTNIRLPFLLAKWARVTKERSGIKIHMRVRIVGDYDPYPDRVVPSTGNVSDYEGSDWLVDDPDLIFVMDRGYVCYKRMDRWAASKLRFVIRVNTHHYVTVLKEHPIPESDAAFITRDATVRMGNNARTTMKRAVRLVEFYDEQGRFYRVATTCWKQSAKDIADMYRQRWQIELFFKWMKQHMHLVQLYSHQPQAVWNHIFLALAAFGLAYLVKLDTQAKQSLWHLLQLIRIYAIKNWHILQKELSRAPSRRSKGRQKTTERPPEQPVNPSDVVLVKPSKRRK